MALRLYGGTAADFLTDPAGNWDGKGHYSVSAAKTPFTPIDATAPVTDENGAPFTDNQPVANDVGQVIFTVPDTFTSALWVATWDPIAGAWRSAVQVSPADIPTRLATVESSTASSSALTAETNARTAADSAETLARTAADAAEAALRATGDANEANTRAAADAAETAARAAAVAAEAATRADVVTAEQARAQAAEAAVSAAVSAVQATVNGILAGAPGAVDTFIEAYNRFIVNEDAAAALTTTVAGKVAKSLFDANTILKADTDDTPVALPVPPSTFLGRKASGPIVALTPTETVAELAAPLNAAFAPIASPTFTGTISLSGAATLSKRTLNGADDNVFLVLGTGQAITDQANDVYIATISPPHVHTTGALARAIGLNIGQWIVTADDGAANLTRTAEFANIEHDFIQFDQTGGTAIYNKVVSSRFRFSIPKTGVTIVDNKGIDFVVPNAGDVTGAVTNYVAINIPALTGGGGAHFYGIRYANDPADGSIAATPAVNISVRPNGGGTFYISDGTAALGAIGPLQFIPKPGSPVSHRIAFGTDGSGFKLAWAKNQGGTITDLLTLQDNGDLALVGSSGKITTPTFSAQSGLVSLLVSGRNKTFGFTTASPKDVLQIISNGASGGWHGCVDLMVSNSAGTAFTVLRVDGAGTATGAVGFFGVTPSGKRATTADATDLASVITLANALKADLQAYGLKT